ncbi:MAG: serine/threonine protein kinase [Myxococcales bacterium]|nr:serine/threonine protein kinase [Myxococcales bacterium]
MLCPDEASVLAFAQGGGDAAARGAIEAHADRCASCLELIVHAARLAAGSVPSEGDDMHGFAMQAPASERYELGHEIARGGMGRIFAAHDRVLGREVAIKCVREDRASLEARFAREVALTAQLEHPAIVPIHDAGRLPDGRRFYAMRRIGGQPMDRRIAEAADLKGRLALLPHVIALADAMAYVHAQGVMHRDLKPHNVLIGDFGETVLIDWGLAKRLEDPELATVPPPTEGDGATLDGEIVGTRGYMAPEQAGAGAVGLPADVYGLGATLLHVITGRPPDPALELHAIAELRSVPPDLAAIVARALAADPSQRYPSAGELAGDLHRFQAGRMVEAHPYTAGQLVRRWLARHRTAVLFATAAVLAISVVGVIAVRRVVEEREVARTERARAEEHRDGAQELISFVLGNVRDELEQVGRLDALAGAAREVVRYYDRVHDGANDRLHRAMALGLLAQTQRDRGDSTEAVRLLRQSVELARASLAQHASPQAAKELGLSLHELGNVGRLVRAPDATAALRECTTMARARIPGPDAATWRWILANATVELALDAHDQGDDAAAERMLHEAIQTAGDLEAAGDARGTHALARAAARLAQLHTEQGEWTKASAATETLRAAALRDAAQSPHDADLQLALSIAWERTGDVRNHHDQLTEAAAAYAESYRIRTALVALEPKNAGWSQALGAAEERLGRLASARGDHARGLAHATASRDISARLVAQDPHNWTLVSELATSELNLATALGEQGDHDRARIAFTRALELYQQVDRESPSAEMKQSVAMTWIHLGNLEVTARRPAFARTALDRGLALSRIVLAQDDTPYTRQLIANGLLALAEAAPDRATVAFAEASEVMAPLRALAAADPEIRDLLAEIDRERSR